MYFIFNVQVFFKICKFLFSAKLIGYIILCEDFECFDNYLYKCTLSEYIIYEKLWKFREKLSENFINLMKIIISYFVLVKNFS
jgi:hypothetical protein